MVVESVVTSEIHSLIDQEGAFDRPYQLVTAEVIPNTSIAAVPLRIVLHQLEGGPEIGYKGVELENIESGTTRIMPNDSVQVNLLDSRDGRKGFLSQLRDFLERKVADCEDRLEKAGYARYLEELQGWDGRNDQNDEIQRRKQADALKRSTLMYFEENPIVTVGQVVASKTVMHPNGGFSQIHFVDIESARESVEARQVLGSRYDWVLAVENPAEAFSMVSEVKVGSRRRLRIGAIADFGEWMANRGAMEIAGHPLVSDRYMGDYERLPIGELFSDNEEMQYGLMDEVKEGNRALDEILKAQRGFVGFLEHVDDQGGVVLGVLIPKRGVLLAEQKSSRQDHLTELGADAFGYTLAIVNPKDINTFGPEFSRVFNELKVQALTDFDEWRSSEVWQKACRSTHVYQENRINGYLGSHIVKVDDHLVSIPKQPSKWSLGGYTITNLDRPASSNQYMSTEEYMSLAAIRAIVIERRTKQEISEGRDFVLADHEEDIAAIVARYAGPDSYRKISAWLEQK